MKHAHFYKSSRFEVTKSVFGLVHGGLVYRSVWHINVYGAGDESRVLNVVVV